MKIAASDFDGTLYTRRDAVSAANVAAIRRWREAGHVFGIVTGRDRDFLLHTARQYDVPYDFLVCNNGAIIFDRDLRPIYSACIDSAVLCALLDDTCVEGCLDRILSMPEKSVAFDVAERSWILCQKIPVQIVDLDVARQQKNVAQVSFSFSTEDAAQSYAAALERRFGDALSPQQNAVSLDVTPPGITKSTGIKNLLRFKGWEGAAVSVIGDESNDLTMLRDFGGFAVASARDEIKRAACKVYADVAEMLLDRL